MTSPEQAKLDAYAAQVAAQTIWKTSINGHSVADLLWHLWRTPDMNSGVGAAIAKAQAADKADTTKILAAVQGIGGDLVKPAPWGPFVLARTPDGAVYAAGPGTFVHVADQATLAAGVAAGLWAGWAEVRDITPEQRDLLLAFTATPNGAYVPPVAAPAPDVTP